MYQWQPVVIGLLITSVTIFVSEFFSGTFYVVWEDVRIALSD
jgi:hypothetical protein